MSLGLHAAPPPRVGTWAPTLDQPCVSLWAQRPTGGHVGCPGQGLTHRPPPKHQTQQDSALHGAGM